MRTTVDLDDELMKQAMAATKRTTTTAFLEEGLRSPLRQEACRQLIAMGGSGPPAKGASFLKSKG
jgi:Arc/MetJ family transcription regulator